MSGPSFLLLYAALALLANVWLRRRQRAREAARPGRFMEIAQDPCQVAYLRAGDKEALHVAVFSLVDRGLLEESGGSVRRARADAQSFARRPLEQAVLASCGNWTTVEQIANHSQVEAACQRYRASLGAGGLLADDAVYAERQPLFLALFALLVGAAALRIAWALAHGRHNVGFLVIAALTGVVALGIGWRRRRTGLGDAALDRLRVLFAKLKSRAKELRPGGASNEAALAAAVFGLAVLPLATFPFRERLFPKPKSDGDGGGGDGGSDGGGGCGGGGCGGGCGG